MQLTERLEKANRLHAQGYNCAQCVLMSIPEITGLDEQTAAALGAPLGAGLGQGEICGVANAIAIASGLHLADSKPDGKKRAIPVAKELCNLFSAPYGGKIRCRDLKGKCGVSCDKLIQEGITIITKRNASLP